MDGLQRPARRQAHPFGERFSLELIADMFNIANRYNVAAVSPLFTNAGQPTAAYDPRQFQFANEDELVERGSNLRTRER